jgi:hypothetical protein
MNSETRGKAKTVKKKGQTNKQVKKQNKQTKNQCGMYEQGDMCTNQ